jgi:hypothetical protein
MRSSRRHGWLLFITLLFLSLSGTGLAAEKITVTPRLAVGWQLDDNFFKAEAITREVTTFLVQPGVDVGVETAKALGSASLTLNNYTYSDVDPVPYGQQPADEDNYTGYALTLKGRYRPSPRLLGGLEYSDFNTRDPAQSDVFSNSISREKYTIRRVTPQVFYEFDPKFSMGLKYRYTDTDYDVATGEDSAEHRAIFDLLYSLGSQASLDLEYQHWNRDYSLTTSGYTSDQINLIFRKEFRYLALEAGGGYQDRSFDKEGLEAIDVFTYRVAAIGQNPPAPDPAPRSYIAFAFEQNFNDQGLAEKYFLARRLSLTARRLFREKIIATIELFHQASDYETTTGLTPAGTIELREDETLGISGSVGYIIAHWVTFSLAAGFEQRDSNLAGLSYDNTYFIAKFDLSYRLRGE